jgi:hypothetical protein
MRRSLLIFVAAGLTFSGCDIIPVTGESDGRAQRRMKTADSLEQEGNFRSAAAAYASVAEQFPQSSYYPAAVRRAALMYSISPYAAANDSAAYRWYLAYLTLNLSRPERENVRVSVELLHRVLLLHAQIEQIYTSSDSLAVLSKKQSTTLNADAHRMQELELELKDAKSELRKIKEIDIRLSKSRTR